MRCTECNGRGRIRGIDDYYECPLCRESREITAERFAHWDATEGGYSRELEARLTALKSIASDYREYEQLAFDLGPVPQRA